MALKAKFECEAINKTKSAGVEATLFAIPYSQSDFTNLAPLGTLKIKMQKDSKAFVEMDTGKKYIMTLEEVIEQGSTNNLNQ